jgi:uncharacterized membrane protein
VEGLLAVGAHMFVQSIYIVTKIMEIIGVSVIVIGAFVSCLLYFKQVLAKIDCSYDLLRKRLGRSILLGLEFLVAADIINTVSIEPTMNSVLVLGVIIIIRTFLSFSLEIELEKRLPWKEK